MNTEDMTQEIDLHEPLPIRGRYVVTKRSEFSLPPIALEPEHVKQQHEIISRPGMPTRWRR